MLAIIGKSPRAIKKKVRSPGDKPGDNMVITWDSSGKETPNSQKSFTRIERTTKIYSGQKKGPTPQLVRLVAAREMYRATWRGSRSLGKRNPRSLGKLFCYSKPP